MKKSLIAIALLSGILILISCKGKDEITENQTELSAVATTTSKPVVNNSKDPLCDDVNDIILALPKYKSFENYNFYSVTCLANRAYSIEYNHKDETKSSKFTIVLYDTRHPDNTAFLSYLEDGFKSAEQTNDPKKTRVSKLNIGAKEYIRAINNEENSGGTYDCLIKDHYYLHFIVVEDKSLATTDLIEGFVGKYLKSIQITKLK